MNAPGKKGKASWTQLTSEVRDDLKPKRRCNHTAASLEQELALQKSIPREIYVYKYTNSR